mgnify:CR=1 FL=1
MVVTVLVVFAILLYIYIYTRPKRDVQLIQTQIDSFNPDLLLEKQPVLIYSEIVDKKEFIDISFRYQYMFSKEIWVANGDIIQNNSKFALIHNDTEEDREILIRKRRIKTKLGEVYHTHLGGDDEFSDYIKVILKPYNVLVLPYLFEYKSTKDIKITYLTDVLHAVSP